MRDINFKYISQGNNLYLQYVGKSIDIVQYQLKMIRYNKELPFIEINDMTINEDTYLNYNITGYYSIYDCIEEMAISEKGIIDILNKVISVLSDIDNYLLSRDNINFDMKKIFYNPNTYDLKFIYIPVRTEINESRMNEKVFILNLLFAYKALVGESYELEQIIIQVREEKISFERLKEHLDNLKINRSYFEQPPMPPIKKKRFWSFKREKKESVFNTNNLYLIFRNCSNVEKILIENESYIIGRLEESVDILIRNDSIGRVHGKIEKDQNNHYYTDLNSKNGSYLNGERLIPEKRYIIRDGSELRLANIIVDVVSDRGI